MNETTFVEKVKNQFDYLEKEYGFKVVAESNSTYRPYTDGAIEYASNSTTIFIDSDTGYASLILYRNKDGRSYYITPVDIYEYLNTNSKEKELLLSTDPKNKAAASKLSNDKLLLSQPGWSGGRGTSEDVEKRLRNYATWLKGHAELCLLGDFSRWPDIFEYKVKRMRADHLRSGRDEMIFVEKKQEDGNYKLIKIPRFSEKLEFAEKMKKEFGG